VFQIFIALLRFSFDSPSYIPEQNVFQKATEKNQKYFMSSTCVPYASWFLRQFKKGDSVHIFLKLYIQQPKTVSGTSITKTSYG
jgi:hypothetical protein